MAEFKRNFTKSRMNKDLDERLVSNGEYRDAQNIEVLSSDGSDVGTVQTCLGNSLISDITPGVENSSWNAQTGVDIARSTCVGAIEDDKTNNLYYLISGHPKRGITQLLYEPALFQRNWISSDIIAEYNTLTNETHPVLVDIYSVDTAYKSVALTIPIPPNGWGAANNQLDIASTAGIRIGMEVNIYEYPFPFPPSSIVTGAPNNLTRLPIVTKILTSTSIEISESIILPLPSGPNQYRIRFSAPRVLNFDHGQVITGINIVDGMLFWTDDKFEPKKVNITRGKEGSIPSLGICGACNFSRNTNNPYMFNGSPEVGTTHTELVVEGATIKDYSKNGITLNPPWGIEEYVKEEHITVIKKSPLTPPSLDMRDSIRRMTPQGVIHNTEDTMVVWSWYGTVFGVPGFYPVGTTSQQVNDPINIPSNPVMLDLDNGADFRVGDTIECSLSSGGPVLVKLLVTSSNSTALNPSLVSSPSNGNLEVEIIWIDSVFLADTTTNINLTAWYFKVKSKKESLYELKFPRFGYRYKYEDGEYSTFSPFSEIAFLPQEKELDYHPKKGYNLSMVNDLKQLFVQDFVPTNIPLDVVEVDILYKESDSPNIYTIRTFESTDPEWSIIGTGNHKGKFEIDYDLIHAAVASNQLLRPWDNVPRKALAQEVTGNRLVYGNYLQNYDITDANMNEIKPSFASFAWSDNIDIVGWPEKSLKSNRIYQLGVAYKDIYGRETPVLSHPTGVVKIDSAKAASSNGLNVQLINPAPPWADSFKYYIKEISNEYYSMAMDRWYNAKDEGIWLSFPSEDRNKVDDETTLVLKRGASFDPSNPGPPILELARYKILAIKNEAPDFIKTIGEKFADFDAVTTTTSVGHFISTGYPAANTDFIKIEDGAWEGSPLHSLQHQNNQQAMYSSMLGDKSMSLQMRIIDSSGANFSNWYDIVNITYKSGVTGYYQINVTDYFKASDMAFTGTNAAPVAGLKVQIQKKSLENKAEFDGRFFVKVHDDDAIIRKFITSLGIISGTQARYQQLLFWMGGKSSVDGMNPNLINSLDLSSLPGYYEPYDASTNPYPEGTLTRCVSCYGMHFNNLTDPNGNAWIQQTVNGPDCPTRDDLDWIDIYKNVGPYNGHGVYEHWVGGGGAIIPGNPTKSHGGDYEEGGFWFIDQEPTYRPIRGTVWDTNSNTAISHVDFVGTIPYGAYEYDGHAQYSGWGGGGTNRGSLIKFTSDTGIGARDGATEMDISWIGTRNWPGTTSTYNGTWKDICGLHPWTCEFIHNISYPGKVFRFIDDPDNIEYEIGNSVGPTYHFNHDTDSYWIASYYNEYWARYRHRWRLSLIEPGSKDANNPNGIPLPIATGGGASATGNTYYATNPPNTNTTTGGILEGPGANRLNKTRAVNQTATRAGIEFIEPFVDQETKMSEHPAIWETEPKKDVGLDIYHEIGQSYPVNMCDGTEELYIHPEAKVEMHHSNNAGTWSTGTTPLWNYNNWANGNIWSNILNQAIPPAVRSSTIFPSVHERTFAGNRITHIGYMDPIYNDEIAPGFNHTVILSKPFNSYINVGMSIDADMQTVPGTIIQSPQTFFGSPYTYITAIDILPSGHHRLTLDIGVPNANIFTIPIALRFISTASIPVHEITIPTVVRSIVGCSGSPTALGQPQTTIVTLNNGQVLDDGDQLLFTNPDGSTVTATVAKDSLTALLGGQTQHLTGLGGASHWRPQNIIELRAVVHGEKQKLLYHNCYTFGNGVESNRVRDLFNAVTIDKGVRVSTTLAEQYKEERRETGLIFSGIYNSKSGVNRLNQFIMAEDITKDLNPEYGSIQKLHQRDTDLITLCEDKVLKILSHKDALYNADDTKNITATQNVLGNSIPFVGEYGISKNPESFASEAFRAYFTDKERGAVLRLSRDGLTPISDVGMKDWFADNLTSFDFNLGINDKIIGSYDRRRSLYNITHRKETNDHWLKGTTLSFSEGAGGWVSFKSFDAEIAISLNNEYYTGLLGKLWKHHDNTVDRNSFHDWTYDNSNEFTAVNRGIINSRSYITLLFNDLPNVIKSFNTLNYEGSQSKVHQNLSDDPDGIWVEKHRNNWPEVGWYVNSITTDQQVGTIPGKIGQYAWDPEQGEYEGEFINKEGKWFNYIIGKETIWTNGKSTGISPPLGSGNLDTQEFAVQGISTAGNMLACGCPDPTACNYQSWATCDDGSCYPCN